MSGFTRFPVIDTEALVMDISDAVLLHLESNPDELEDARCNEGTPWDVANETLWAFLDNQLSNRRTVTAIWFELWEYPKLRTFPTWDSSLDFSEWDGDYTRLFEDHVHSLMMTYGFNDEVCDAIQSAVEDYEARHGEDVSDDE